MNTLQIAIIIGSTRPGRFGDQPTNWIHDIARTRHDVATEIVDLRDHVLPFFDAPAPPAMVPATDPAAKKWAQRLARFDGFIVVTPEYNHGPTAVLKNAFDWAYAEFVRKPLAFVGYGSVGAARSIEQLRLLAVSFRMAPLNSAVNIGMLEFTSIAKQVKTFDDFPYLGQAANAMLDDLVWWSRALKTAREGA